MRDQAALLCCARSNPLITYASHTCRGLDELLQYPEARANPELNNDIRIMQNAAEAMQRCELWRTTFRSVDKA